MPAEDVGYQIGLLSGIRLTTLARLVGRLHTVSPRRAGRLGLILAASAAAAPLALIERVISRPTVHPSTGGPPVFIIGHWRSGTTHLHNLMSRDPQFACLPMFQALAPDYHVSSEFWLRPLLERVVPNKRPMDNMEWPMGAPQEEEIPLAKVTPHSWYLQFLFPAQAVETFQQSVLLDGASSRLRREIKNKLFRVYQGVAAKGGGRRLLLKNPVHTARIPLLLELFPDARFVYIHRSPYDVFASTRNLHHRILRLTSLQEIDNDKIESNVLELYALLLGRYLRDRSAPAPNRLVEVAFADLEANPCRVIEDIYGQLELGDFERLRPTISAYVRSLADYQKNAFPELTDREISRVNNAWAAGFDNFGYERAQPERTAEPLLAGAD